MESLIREWEGESVLIRFDRPTGTWMFIAIHSTALGVAGGGTRLKSYPHPRDALRDAMRLAEGMTYKFALAHSPFGGGKAVLAVPENFVPSQREGLMLRYGQWLAALNNNFVTGADVGTGPGDMVLIAQHVPVVYGLPVEQGGTGDQGAPTALGVLYGIQVCCEHFFGAADLSGRTVLVQGVGSVGGALVQMLLDAGCEVKFSDVDAKQITKFRDELGLAYVEPMNVYREPCDVFAPCATGGILNAETIPRLACRIVAGSANNQLGTPEDGERLHQRGILYAPDFAINAGAVIYTNVILLEGLSHEEANERLHNIADNLREIFALAKAQNISTAQAAKQLALERLHQAAKK